jgi:hypothetical protein
MENLLFTHTIQDAPTYVCKYIHTLVQLTQAPAKLLNLTKTSSPNLNKLCVCRLNRFIRFSQIQAHKARSNKRLRHEICNTGEHKSCWANWQTNSLLDTLVKTVGKSQWDAHRFAALHKHRETSVISARNDSQTRSVSYFQGPTNTMLVIRSMHVCTYIQWNLWIRTRWE